MSVFLVQAIQAIDADIAQQLLLRKNHIDGVETSFYDPTMLSQNSVSLIPESLGPKPGRLSLSQQRVYEVLFLVCSFLSLFPVFTFY